MFKSELDSLGDFERVTMRWHKHPSDEINLRREDTNINTANAQIMQISSIREDLSNANGQICSKQAQAMQKPCMREDFNSCRSKRTSNHAASDDTNGLQHRECPNLLEATLKPRKLRACVKTSTPSSELARSDIQTVHLPSLATRPRKTQGANPLETTFKPCDFHPLQDSPLYQDVCKTIHRPSSHQ